ncbi:hypothetical protein D3C87_995650 [compost metagenome]
MAELSKTQQKKRARTYDRAGIVPIDEVLPLIRDNSIKSVVLHGHKVNVTSLRLRNFAKSCTCIACGLEATHFAVEDNTGYAWHLNLWADRGPDKKEMLFTHDHTLARALGGADDEANTTTMCAKCNHQKGRVEYIEVCKLRGLPLPGSKRASVPVIYGCKTDVLDPGARVVKKSGKPFKSGDEIGTVEAICTSLYDPHRRPAYVIVEDQTIVNCHQCLQVA